MTEWIQVVNLSSLSLFIYFYPFTNQLKVLSVHNPRKKNNIHRLFIFSIETPRLTKLQSLISEKHYYLIICPQLNYFYCDTL